MLRECRLHYPTRWHAHPVECRSFGAVRLYACVYMYVYMYAPQNTGVSEVPEQDLHDMLKRNPALLVVDIREESEVARMPIPSWWNAIELPPGCMVCAMFPHPSLSAPPSCICTLPFPERERRRDVVACLYRVHVDNRHKPSTVHECTQYISVPVPILYLHCPLTRNLYCGNIQERDIGKHVPDLNTELILVCAGGQRSVLAAQVCLHVCAPVFGFVLVDIFVVDVYRVEPVALYKGLCLCSCLLSLSCTLFAGLFSCTRATSFSRGLQMKFPILGSG